ncbi:TrbI/VirB10 family protein [Altericroceibacterium xinjiangense]|uniref:TrbI/VirB10 family protein n=1 Tax=Altericroceibacterium xinjiangense TaxID=762261 RepID=UPI001F499C86|nr:TrbI/VirB10 family protein [Altericroceibacterium xinjiangense]
MRLAMRLPERKATEDTDIDPREQESAEIIDLASRTSYPMVTQRKGKSDALGLATGIGVVALLGAATLWGLSNGRMEQPAAEQPGNAATPVPAAAPAPAPVVSAPPPAPMAMAANPAPSPVLANPPMANPAPAANPYSSPTVVFDASSLPPMADAAPLAAPDAAGQPGSAGASDFASRIGGIGGAPAQARVDIDPATTVTQGTMIPAVLETAIDTDVPGYVRAVVSQDVRSFDGRRVLVPRSSRLVGQYQSGLQAGQKRAYVIWTRLIRPDGVSVQLASPATGFDGTTGLAGKVDNHFFQKFGSAMLLSVVGGLSAIGTGGASLIVGGGTSAASAAVTEGGKIGPTVRVRQGEPIRVFTARDLDFSRAPRL